MSDADDSLKIGVLLGEVRSGLAQSNERSARLEEQNSMIIAEQAEARERAHDQGDELKKLATELVHMRAEMKAPMRAQLPSYTNEVRESVRVAATEATKQTELLEQMAGSVPQAAMLVPQIRRSEKNNKWLAIAVAVAALSGFGKAVIDLLAAHH